MRNNIFKFVFLILGITILNSSCTDLSETIYNDLTAEGFYSNADEVQSAVLRPYTHARAWAAPTGQQSFWRLTEYSGDQLAWPQKGVDGYDDGKWMRLHWHSWTYTDYTVQRAWELMFWGMGLCNDAIENIEANSADDMGITEDERTAYIAEERGLRAFTYLKIMDLWGNVPIVKKVGDPEYPATEDEADVYDWIESELLDIVDDLPVLTSSNTGRITRAAGYAMLAELYLNGEVWRGVDHYEDCIAYCDSLIDGYGGCQIDGEECALDGDIETTFSNTNTTSSTENLFVLAYDYQNTTNYCGWNSDMYHFNEDEIYGGDKTGNNGTIVIPTAYDAFDDNDLRKSDWMLIGAQYEYDDPSTPVQGYREYSGQPLVFVNYVCRVSEGEDPENPTSSTMYDGEENSGARFNKYKPGAGSKSTDNYWSNDWVLYRLTEFYFDKAEALMRQNGGTATQTAVDLINTCRERCFSASDWATGNYKYTTTTLTMDELLAERGREFIFEGKRRTDLIRFGVFTSNTWWDHDASNDESTDTLFPIPYTQLSVNSNLKQNPGYQD